MPAEPSRVAWVSIGTRESMGLQGYEHGVQDAMRAAAPADLRFDRVLVTSVRGDVPGARRVPMGLYHRLPLPGALVLGAAAYRSRALVHRFDLRIPPAPGTEIVTIHDLPPFHFSDEGTVPRSAAAGARRAARVICPSAFAADEITSLLGVEPDRIRVIPNGVGAEFGSTPAASAVDLRALGIAGRYVVHAAGATQRKNLAALAGAWTSIAPASADVTLVLCGPPDPRRDTLFSDVPNTVLAGALPSARVAALMAGAAAVVVPSLYEGFGLPVLEGMASGAPVVAAATGALPEVCGGAAVLVAPTAHELAGGLARVLNDPVLAADLGRRGRVRASTFSWASAAAAHLDVYREVLAG